MLGDFNFSSSEDFEREAEAVHEFPNEIQSIRNVNMEVIRESRDLMPDLKLAGASGNRARRFIQAEAQMQQQQ